MSTKHPSSRYYKNFRDIRKQLPQLIPIVVVFVLTVLYASGLENHTTRTVMLCLSLVYLVVIAFNLSFAIPKLSYFQIDSNGIHITILGLINRHIYWSDIESIGPVTSSPVASVSAETIGIMYRPSFKRYVFGRKSRKRMFGWDEVLTNAHTKDGASLDNGITENFKKHLSIANR